MKKLTQKEAESLNYKSGGFRKESKAAHIYAAIAHLSNGEALLIEKNEWPLKSKPNTGNIPKKIAIPYAR